MIVLILLTLLAKVAGEPAPATPTANRWSEPTRGILAQRCGSCHLPNLPTSVSRALAVFNLTEDPWYGRLSHEQYGDLLHRLRSVKDLPESDMAIVERFVRCARDSDCPTVDP